jgi:cytochrome oxidase complex assembly protein 1
VTVDYTKPPVVPPPPPPPVASAVPPQKGSSGCLKWGCIGCGALLVLGCAFVAIIFFVVIGAMKSSDVYRGALARASADARVTQALGSPVKDGLWIIGSVDVKDSTGSAEITFPIEGPKGHARVHAVATKEAGHWSYSELTVTPENGPEIDLLKP